MTLIDTLRFSARAAQGYPLRTLLMVLAMSIGVAAVVALTALGEGARLYIVSQFASLGTNLIMLMPGRTETGGINPGSFINSTTRDLTVEDAAALQHASLVKHVAPLAMGNSELAFGGKLRNVTVLGTSTDYLTIRHYHVAQGHFLPPIDFSLASSVAVIGETLRREIFGAEPAVGRMIRVGDTRLRIIGVLSPSGQGLGMNADEAVIVPVATALSMFNTNNLFRIMLEAKNREAVASTIKQVENIMQRRRGTLDVTLITQDAVLKTFDRILAGITMGIAGIAAISLTVAGVLVMNVMLVAVTQRTGEIGLLKALGATERNIRLAFLTEAILLSMTGAITGFMLGHTGAWIIRTLFPALPAWPPDWAVFAGLGSALLTGALFGVMPARRAALLHPVQALAKR